jgi:hypothetical protein
MTVIREVICCEIVYVLPREGPADTLMGFLLLTYQCLVHSSNKTSEFCSCFLTLSKYKPDMDRPFAFYSGPPKIILIYYVQSTVHQTMLWTLYHSYSKGICVDIELQVYSVTCC